MGTDGHSGLQLCDGESEGRRIAVGDVPDGKPGDKFMADGNAFEGEIGSQCWNSR